MNDRIFFLYLRRLLKELREKIADADVKLGPDVERSKLLEFRPNLSVFGIDTSAAAEGDDGLAVVLMELDRFADSMEDDIDNLMETNKDQH